MIMPYNYEPRQTGRDRGLSAQAAQTEQTNQAVQNSRPKCKRHCLRIITAILAGLLGITVGLILGAIFFIPLLIALPALIVLSIVLLILLALNIIYTICSRGRGCDCD